MRKTIQCMNCGYKLSLPDLAVKVPEEAQAEVAAARSTINETRVQRDQLRQALAEMLRVVDAQDTSYVGRYFAGQAIENARKAVDAVQGQPF